MLPDADADTEIDTHLSYRYDCSYLPILPIVTSYKQIPKEFSQYHPQIAQIQQILKDNKVSFSVVEFAHRMHQGTPVSASTLILYVLSKKSNNSAWPAAIRALHTYLTTAASPLASISVAKIEFIDTRFFTGVYTLPLLPTEKPALARAIQRRTLIVHNIITEKDLKIASINLFYRGLSARWKDCKPTCLLGGSEMLPGKGESKWWDVVMPRVKQALGKALDVEAKFARGEN